MPANNNTAALLNQMLAASRGAQPAQGEDDGTRLLAQPAHMRVARRAASVDPRPAGYDRLAPTAPILNDQTTAPGFDADWARENPGYCTGRGPTGRLRNFRAMNPTKLSATYAAVLREQNDPQAMAAIIAEQDARRNA